MASETARVRKWQTAQDGLEKLYLAESPMPKPGKDEVLVEIRAVSINYRDTEGEGRNNVPRKASSATQCTSSS
jgi:NADPH:quinone reductase-like Zn-dependent oxidoreductase